MSINHYITSSCIISNNTVYKNGLVVFVNKNVDLPAFLLSVYQHFELSYPRFYKMDNLSKLGWLTAEILLKDSFEKEKYKSEEIGLILSNANSSLDSDQKYLKSVADIPSPALFVYTLPNIMTGEICIRNNFKGEDAFFVTENFDAGFTEQYVNSLFNNQVLLACICGWVDVIGNEYKSALFLVEEEEKQGSVVFNADNMKEVFESDIKSSKTISEPVFVAGVGAITAIGNNVAECLSSFENERAGMGDITYMNTVHQHQIPVAEVKLSNEELAAKAGVSAELSRTTLLSLLAAREALDDAGIPDIASLRTGFVSANTVGGMDKSEGFFIDFIKDNSKGKLKNVFDHECGSVTEAVANQLGIKDYMTTISTACSSSANAIFYGARLIKNGLLDVVVAGGTDGLTKFTLNGFNTLMILDKEFCKPFDENRQGLNLGEGAGYMVLVSEKVAKTLSKPLYAKLSGYNNSNDAYHQTASSPEGTGSYLAMQGALGKAGLKTSDIDYINLHGTGTPNNDSAEGTAIKRLFEKDFPPMSSTKSFTGHTLGASGGVEAVFSVLAIKEGIIYPNLRFETPMHELPFVPETQFLKGRKINHVMSNSFGFGGNCTSLIFSRI
ncbi:MAG: beta-ketoacyl-[acyl-carrier-protein] synthase family protein [Mucilaginibacter sp.]|nr:beta-ketoacyl-[acyl-carrier-protein] synthase family protein [Mucilaginibacter sp.]